MTVRKRTEMPRIRNTNYMSNTMNVGDMTTAGMWVDNTAYEQKPYNIHVTPSLEDYEDANRTAEIKIPEVSEQEEEMAKKNSSRRLVKVLIVDPDDRLPLGECVLMNGNEFMTDLSDQELYFEYDVKAMLDKHNKKREGIVDEKWLREEGKKRNLEPIRIKDLSMSVVTIAQF